MKRFIVVFCLFPVLGYSIYINDIDLKKEEVSKLSQYFRYRAIADTVFEKSKVSSIKYYELVLEGIKNDFVSLARLSLVYSIKDVPELALYYGTNALEVYKSIDKSRIYTINYIELMVSLSMVYATLNDEPKSYSYLDEAKTSLSKLILFKNDYSKAKELIDFAEQKYRDSFYKSSKKTNFNITN
ncbi:MAG: hypothetical protein ACP5PT_04120 [Brevinematia bacterium]